MGFALIWIELLLCVLLWVAAVTSCSARLTWRPGQVGLPVVGALVPLVLLVAATVLAGQLGQWSGYILGLTVATAMGSAVVLFFGLRPGAAALPTARDWPWGKLALACAIAWALHCTTVWNLDSAVQIGLVGLKGEAGALALSVAPPPVADRHNAALVYEQAFQAMTPSEKWPKESDQWFQWIDGDADFDPQDKTLRDFLQQQETALVLLRQAAAMPDCSFEHQYAQPSLDMQLPEVMPLRNGARLLALRACVKAADGQPAAALDDVAAIYAIGAHAAGEPTLVNWLVGIAVDRLGFETLERVLASGSVTEQQLESLQLTGAVSYGRTLRRALRMEEAFGLSLFAQITGGTNASELQQGFGLSDVQMTQARLGRSYWRIFLLQNDLSGYRNAMSRYQQVLNHPYQQWQTEMQQIEDSIVKQRAHLVSSLILPAISSIAVKGVSAEARWGLAQLAVAVSRCKADTGNYPDAPQQLVEQYLPRLPTDPYSGESFKMRADQGGIILYSVGPDGADDNGAALDESVGQGDISFCLGTAHQAGRHSK